MELTELLALLRPRQAMVIGSIHPVARARLLDEAIQRSISEQRADAERVRALADLAVRLAERAGEVAAATRARLELANAQRRLGRHAEGLATLVVVEPVLKSNGSHRDVTRFLSYRASIAIAQGDWRRALADLAVAKQSCHRSVAPGLWTKEGMAADMDDPSRAAKALWRAVQLAEELEDPVTTNCASHNIVGLLIDSGRPELAEELLERLRPLNDRVGSDSDRLKAKWQLGMALAATGRHARAFERLRSLTISALRDDRYEAQFGLHLALDALAVGRTRACGGDVTALLEEVVAAIARRDVPAYAPRLLGRARLAKRRELPGVLGRLRTALGGPAALRGEQWLDPERARRRAPGLKIPRHGLGDGFGRQSAG